MRCCTTAGDEGRVGGADPDRDRSSDWTRHQWSTHGKKRLCPCGDGTPDSGFTVFTGRHGGVYAMTVMASVKQPIGRQSQGDRKNGGNPNRTGKAGSHHIIVCWLIWRLYVYSAVLRTDAPPVTRWPRSGAYGTAAVIYQAKKPVHAGITSIKKWFQKHRCPLLFTSLAHRGKAVVSVK